MPAVITAAVYLETTCSGPLDTRNESQISNGDIALDHDAMTPSETQKPISHVIEMRASAL